MNPVFSVFLLGLSIITSPALSQNDWQQTNMPLHLSIYAMASDNSGNVYAGGYGQGLFRSSDHGTSWDSAGMTGYWVRSMAVSSSDNIFLVGIGDAYGAGVFRSTDHGTNWKNIYKSNLVNCVHVAGDNSIWIGLQYSHEHNGIFRSTDNGESWDSVFSDTKNFNCIATLSGGKIFSGSYGRVYRSLDNGKTWSYSKKGLANAKITAIAVNKAGQVFVATAGYGIFRSDDEGTTWKEVGESSGPDYSCLLVDKNQNIYTGTQGYWVYKSTDNGDNWTLTNSGLTNKYVLSLTMDKDGYLYAGTDTSGVFRSTNKVISGISDIQSSSNQPKLYQNYPNPFAHNTTISYYVSRKTQVSLVVYNLTGKKVRELINESQDKGRHSILFNADNLPDGIYYYTLSMGKIEQSRKMIRKH